VRQRGWLHFFNSCVLLAGEIFVGQYHGVDWTSRSLRLAQVSSESYNLWVREGFLQLAVD